MSETVIDNYLVTQIRTHAGIPITEEVIEAALPSAEEAVKIAKASGHDLSLEFALTDAARALWAEAHQGGKQNVDWPAFVRERLAKKDSLFSKLFKRKSEVQQSIDELKQFEEDVNQARAALKYSEQKVSELKNSIEATERDLAFHSDEAVEASVQQAAAIWHRRDTSPHNSSIVEASVAHAVEAEVINRVLHARLVWLRDKLAAEQSKVTEFEKELKRLEKMN
jgi:hypothetical protein